MWICILLYPLIISLEQIIAEKKVNKYVTTLIDAKWRDTPLVLEVAEYLNDENPNYFWKFIDEVSRENGALQSAG